jgi:predicted small lipoprotein YifL
MKKLFVFILTLMMMISISACGGESPSERSTPTGGSTTSDNSKKAEAKVYGIGEAAEANGLSITIDGAEPFDYTGMLSRPKDGFEYLKVWFTFTNVSDEPIESPDKKDICIIYKEGPTGDDSDLKSEENSQVMLDVADRNERYMEDIELAPGESTGGWMVYQRQTDKSEITMHYYSGFFNVPPDLRFKFTVE